MAQEIMRKIEWLEAVIAELKDAVKESEEAKNPKSGMDAFLDWYEKATRRIAFFDPEQSVEGYKRQYLKERGWEYYPQSQVWEESAGDAFLEVGPYAYDDVINWIGAPG